VVTPILNAWEEPSDPNLMPTYEAGTWEPLEAELLMNRDGRQWRRL